MRLQPSTHRATQRGFSLIELLVVTGIIALLAAVSLPMISQYIRNYKVRAAAQQVASQLQTARAKAIMKNVQLGVTWLPQDQASGWAFEDDLRPTTPPPTPAHWSETGAEDLTAALADRTQSPTGMVNLPTGFVFDNPVNCPGGTGLTPNGWGIRFNNLGGICQIGGANCPLPRTQPAYTATPRIAFSGGNASVCVWERARNLRRLVTVTAGGRVLTQ